MAGRASPVRRYVLRAPLGARPLAAGDFPLAIGGAGAALAVPGIAAGEVAAVITLADGAPWLRPGAVAGALRRDGVPLVAPTALADGEHFEVGGARCRVEVAGEDWTLRVEHAAGDNATEPPVYPSGAEPAPLAALPARQPLAPLPYAAPQPDAAPWRAPWRRIDPRRAGLAALALAAVAALAFLAAATAVSVRVAPDLAPDAVHFGGARIDLPIAGRHLLLPGAYLLRVDKQGYEPLEMPVTVTSATGQRIEAALRKRPGQLDVDTGGIVARVSVDGRDAGAVPGALTLAAGTHVLAFAAPRHAPATARVEIEGLGHRQRLGVALAPTYAPVRIESSPAGAAVSVDGVPEGTTPVTLDLDAGRRLVTLTHPAARSWESTLLVRAGEAQTLGPVALGPRDGRLVVRSEPADADVSVVGAYRGRTPLALALPAGIAAEVLVTRAGYQAATRTVRLEPGATATLRIALVAALGVVEIHGEPADAELLVDGRPAGAASQRLELTATPHTLEIRKPGLESYRATVTPRPGLLQAVDFRLAAAAERPLARLPLLIRSAAGQVLRLVPPGRFTMGSPPGEPGRRGNEPARPVELRRPVYLAEKAVTNAAFRAFRAGHTSGRYAGQSLDADPYPAANVPWRDAADYCNWLSAQDGLPPAYVARGGRLVLASPVTTGYRLPTEAEWEYAARWNGVGNDRRYPWGNELPVPPRAGNYADASAAGAPGAVLADYRDGFPAAAPVGSFAPNLLGFYDLGGNVLEWTSDFYAVYPDATAAVLDPTGPLDGEAHVIRGSSWLTASVAELRLAWRDAGAAGRANLGFRIARYAE